MALALAERGPTLAARLLAAFAVLAAAADLGLGLGILGALASLPGAALLVGSGLLLAGGGAAALARRRLARAATLAGAGVFLASLPPSLLLRDSVARTVIEGAELGPRELPGLPLVSFGRIELLPRGPLFLSKTVSVEARPEGGSPTRVRLFPATALGPWRLSVIRFGYAPGVTWRGRDGRLRWRGRIPLGAVPHDAAEAGLVEWTPETNLMMGAGTYPPRLEELVAGAGGEEHLFLRLEAATLAGQRRNLRDPEAHRWLADGRPEEAVFRVRVLRGPAQVLDATIPAGESVSFEGGTLTLAPDVALYADVLATRDPWLAGVAGGLVLATLGLLGSLASAALRVARRMRRPPPAA